MFVYRTQKDINFFREAQEYEKCEWVERDSFDREEKARKDATDFIQKQFALRRSAQVFDSIDYFLGNVNLRFIEPTSKITVNIVNH